MDRGFGSFHGPGYGTPRPVSDRRYDDFYSDGRRGGHAGRQNFSGAARRDWGGTNNDGFLNQAQGATNSGTGNVGGQIIAAALQQQQQNILTALMSSQQQSRGILQVPTPALSQFQGRRNESRYGGNYGNSRPGDKRKSEQRPSGFQNRKKPAPTPPKSRKTSSQERRPPSTPKKVEEIDIPDSEVEIPDSLMDNVETLRQRKDIRRNVADEDVQKLTVFCFTGKGYHCLTCGLLLTKESAFLTHLDGKSHVMNVIDARTAKKYNEVRDILDIDLAPDDWFEKNENAHKIIFKQAKMIMKTQREIKQREEQNYNKNPANFFTVSMETRKAAVKNGTTVIIKSIVETSMVVKEFGSDRHFGCEFIKAVSGFNCRLCGLHINDSDGVIPHVESRLHKTNYQNHLRKTPGYEKVQTDQNKELRDALAEHEDQFVLLSESFKAGEQTFLASMEDRIVRVPELYKADPSSQTGKKVPKTQQKPTEKCEESSTCEEQDVCKTDESGVEKQPGRDKAIEEVSNGLNESTPNANNAESVDTEKNTTQVVLENPLPEEKEKNVENEKITEESEEHTESEPVMSENSSLEGTKIDAKVSEIDVATEIKSEESPKPIKSILKKTTSKPLKNLNATAKRGRGRGKATPSPRSSRARKGEAVSSIGGDDEGVMGEDDKKEQENSNDNNYMDDFELVDEA